MFGIICLVTMVLGIGVAEETATPPIVPVLFSGTDNQVSLYRAAGASKKELQELELTTAIDLAGKEKSDFFAMVGEQYTALNMVNCEKDGFSNAHVRNLTQTADNNLGYFELDKAGQKLEQAKEGLICLQELLQVSDVMQMYYLTGILEQSKGNDLASVQAFSSAIRLKPDLQWNDYYTPDAKPNFDQAKHEFASLQEISLEIIPAIASSQVWINGTPLLSGESMTVYEGENIVQILGLETQTYSMVVPKDAQGIRLVVPSALPVSANTWVETPEGQKELSIVLQSVLAMDSELLVHDSGKIWKTNIGSGQWEELAVPKFADTRANAKQITGRALFWTGLTTTSVGFGVGAYSYIQGASVTTQAKNTNSWTDYEKYVAQREGLQSQYTASVIGITSGLVLTGIGYVLAF